MTIAGNENIQGDGLRFRPIAEADAGLIAVVGRGEAKVGRVLA